MGSAEARRRRAFSSVPITRPRGYSTRSAMRKACTAMCGCGRRRSPRHRWRFSPGGSRRFAWRQKKRATIVHAHWVVPGGVIGAAAAGSIPLVVSLHGSDVFVAERHCGRPVGRTNGVCPGPVGHRVQRGFARARRSDWGRLCGARVSFPMAWTRPASSQTLTPGGACGRSLASPMTRPWSWRSDDSSEKKDSST